MLNDTGGLAKEGEIGEITLRGVNLMSGYLGESPEKTFQDNIFRTGDLGFFKKSNSDIGRTKK